MKLRYIISAQIFCLLLFFAIAADAQNVKTQIKNVTVYCNGAMVTRQGSLNLKKGDNTLYLNGLSTELDPNTLRVGIANKNVKILSVKHDETVIDNEKLQKQNEDDDNRLEIVRDSLAFYTAELEILNDEEELITANQAIGGKKNGVTTAELKSMTDFYKKEFGANASKRIAINKKIKKLKDEIFDLVQKKENRQKEILKKDSRVKLVVSANSALNNVPVTLSYLVFSASWEPFYEVRADAVNQPLKLVYGAHIKQSTTEDWNGVKLTISTGDPSEGNTAPEFTPMYLPAGKRVFEKGSWAPARSNLIYGIVVDETKEPIIGANVTEEGTQNGTITDLDGKFKLEVSNLSHNLKFNYIGYKEKKVKPYENMHITLEADNAVLEEVVVVGYGTTRGSDSFWSPPAAPAVPKAPKEIKYHENVPLELTNTQTTTEFDIAVPYSVPSDGKMYDVSMITYNIDADYHFSTMPRSSKNVYLLADLKDFSQYPLLRGNAYVYLDNVYQGECEIAPDFAAETYSIPVGKDKDIAISRREVKDLTSKKVLASSVKVVKCVEITVKNNKNAEVEVEVCDQYPLPKFSDIKSEVTDKGGAEIDAEKGKLTWKLKLAPQEKKVLRFTYEVKYPNSYGFTVE